MKIMMTDARACTVSRVRSHARRVRSHVWHVLTVAFCLGLFLPAVVMAGPTESAINSVAAEVAAELAENRGSFTTVAVFPIQGDRNEVFAVAITSALIQQGITVVDRNDESIQTVLSELRRAGSDLYSSEQAPQFGELHVADAVLIAKVREYDPGTHTASMELNVRAIRTQTGDIIWSGIVSAWRPSATAAIVVLSISGLLVLVILLAIMARRRRRKVSHVMVGRDMESRTGQALGKGTSDEDIRMAISRSFSNSKEQLSAARASVEKMQDIELLKALRDVERSMDLARKNVENAATGRADVISVGQAKDTFKFDESMLKAARTIEQKCGSAAEAGVMEDLEALKTHVTELKVEMHRFNSAFNKRSDQLGGV